MKRLIPNIISRDAIWEVSQLPCEMTQIVLPVREQESAFNPSILRTPEGYSLTMRVTERQRRFHQTYTHYMEADKNLTVRPESIPLGNPPPRRSSPLQGLEDTRIYAKQDNLLFATSVHYVDSFATSLLFDVRWLTTGELVSCRPIDGPHITEKNWLVFDDNGQYKAIYATGPYTVVDLATGKIILQLPHTARFSDFRGGGGPLRFNNGWLWIIHQVYYLKGERNRRMYTHRFCWTSNMATLPELLVSRPFYFRHKGIEFASGLSDTDDRVVITLGVDDKTAWIATLPKTVVQGLLEEST